MDKTWIMSVSELLFLYLCAREDYQSRKLWMPRFLLFGIAGMAAFFFLKPFAWPSLVAGVGIGAVILLLSYISRGEMGAGDGWLFCITGVYSGGGWNLALLILSGWLCAGYLLVGIIRKKYRRKDKIAFAPFVFVAQVVLLFLL